MWDVRCCALKLDCVSELYKCVVELEQAEKEYGTQLGILSDLFIPHLK